MLSYKCKTNSSKSRMHWLSFARLTMLRKLRVTKCTHRQKIWSRIFEVSWRMPMPLWVIQDTPNKGNEGALRRDIAPRFRENEELRQVKISREQLANYAKSEIRKRGSSADTSLVSTRKP